MTREKSHRLFSHENHSPDHGAERHFPQRIRDEKLFSLVDDFDLMCSLLAYKNSFNNFWYFFIVNQQVWKYLVCGNFNYRENLMGEISAD